MIDPFFHFFHTYRETLSQNLLHPEAEKVKVYRRRPIVELPEPDSSFSSLAEALQHRSSDRNFSFSDQVSLQKISTLLYWSLGYCGDSKPDSDSLPKSYPSGGAKYPIEPYLFVASDSQALLPGVYHYTAESHRLERLTDKVSKDDVTAIQKGYRYPFAQNVPIFLLFTFIKDRSVPKYGEFAYKLGLIEAGHIAQNVYLLAQQLNLACTAIGGGSEEVVHRLARLDGYNEVFFHTVALGEKRTYDK